MAVVIITAAEEEVRRSTRGKLQFSNPFLCRDLGFWRYVAGTLSLYPGLSGAQEDRDCI